MAVRTYQVLEEYLFEVEGLDFMVKGRISFSEELPPEVGFYYWEISHFWSAGVNTYYPSVRNGKTLEEARMHLFQYAQSFPSGGRIEVAKY